MRRGLIIIGLLLASSVPAAAKKGTLWRIPNDFATIQAAIDSPLVVDGDTLCVRPGTHFGATLTKRLVIQGEGNAVINDGPLHPQGLTYGIHVDVGGGGSTIKNLTFDGLDLAVYVREQDGVTVEHCEFLSAIQGITSWGGSDGDFSHNRFEDLRSCNGGGIGILVGDRKGGTVTGNEVSHNHLEGVLTSCGTEVGGYDGTGVVFYADFRDGQPGTAGISDNSVRFNEISVTSESALVGFNAIEMTDTRDDEDEAPVLFDNTVTNNDMRGSDNGLVLTPENLEDVNTLRKNKL